MEQENGEVHSDDGSENEQPHVANGFPVDVHSEDEHDVDNGVPEQVVIIDEPETESEDDELLDEILNEPLNQPLVVNGFPAHIYSDNDSENEQEHEPHEFIVNEPDDEPQGIHEPAEIHEPQENIVSEDEQENVPVNEPQDNHEPQANIVLEDEQEDVTVNEPQEDNVVPNMKEISEDDWNQMLENVKVEKEFMDKLVMDYLVSRELPEVAQAFHTATGCPLGINDISLLHVQKNVRNLIVSCQFDEAKNLLNARLGMIFLNDRPRISFRLDQQKMIEMCRRNEMEDAINFSREFNEWEKFESPNDDFKVELCNTLLLMLFGYDPDSPSAELLDPMRCPDLATYVVDEMIKFQGRETGSLIEKAMKMLKLEQDQLNQVLKFPNFNIDSGLQEQEHD